MSETAKVIGVREGFVQVSLMVPKSSRCQGCRCGGKEEKVILAGLSGNIDEVKVGDTVRVSTSFLQTLSSFAVTILLPFSVLPLVYHFSLLRGISNGTALLYSFTAFLPAFLPAYWIHRFRKGKDRPLVTAVLQGRD